MSFREMSTDTIMEDSDYSVFSNTNAIVYGSSDISGRTESLISDPNILNSNSTSEYEYHHHQQQISTAAGGGSRTDDLTVSSSCASSCLFKNNNESIVQQEIRIFNVDFRALSSFTACSAGNNRSDFHGGLLPDIRPIGSTETIIRIVNTLTACADAVETNNLDLADELIRDLRILAISQFGSMKELVSYFAEALDQRIHGMNPEYETCPYLEFAHITVNQAIVEAFANCDRARNGRHLCKLSLCVLAAHRLYSSRELAQRNLITPMFFMKFV